MPVSRNSFDDDGWVLGKILDEALCSSFDCGDPDLNDYFHNEAILYSAELLTQRYYLYIPENPSKAIVLLDFCNDGLHVDQYKKAVQLHPDKEVHHLPAVKLTRFGVRKE